MLDSGFIPLSLTRERASGAAVAVFCRNSRDARVRVQETIAIPNCRVFLKFVLIFISLQG